MPRAIVARLEATPSHAHHAAKVVELVESGTSLVSTASALGLPRATAKLALEYARAGGLAPVAHPAPPSSAATDPPPYVRVAPEVVRLRDGEWVPFARIAGRLGLSEATVRRAYDWVHRQDVEAAAAEGRLYRRGRHSRLGATAHARIARLLGEGRSAEEVATEVGCGSSTVYRTLRAMRCAEA